MLEQQDEYLLFIKKIHQKTGLDLMNYKRPQMERRIRTLMRSFNMDSLIEYFHFIDRDAEGLRKFMDHITINVSEFLRNPNQWDVLQNKILPQLLQDNKAIRIWSAGCSTGEEPYSLAMVLKENRINTGAKILAADLDKEVLRKAQIGIYTEKALENVPKAWIAKYFEPQGNGFYMVKDELKQMIQFKNMDLLKDPFDNNFDLILCRNVVIYFTEDTKFKLYKRFYQALRKGGVLFTGSTEQIFQARELGFATAATFFYQKA